MQIREDVEYHARISRVIGRAEAGMIADRSGLVFKSLWLLAPRRQGSSGTKFALLYHDVIYRVES